MVKIAKEDATRMGGGMTKSMLGLVLAVNVFFTMYFIGYFIYEIAHWKGKESLVVSISMTLLMVFFFPKMWRFYFNAIQKRKEIIQNAEDKFILANCLKEAGLEAGVKVKIE